MASSTNGTLQQEESESLLKDGELDWDEAHATHQKQSSSVWSQRIKSLWIFLVHSAFVVLNVILLLVWTQSPLLKDCHANNKTEGGVWGKSASPASPAIQYDNTEVETVGTSSRFTGQPRPEVDQAWSELLASTMVRVSGDELKDMKKTSIALKDGSGYIGYLETYHMLHCIKRLYQAQYPDYYTDLQGVNALSTGHFDHCIEVLRQGVMCNAEAKVNTYFWKTPTEIKGNTTGTRSCADWSRVQAWTNSRKVDFEGAGGEDFLHVLVPSDRNGSVGPL